MIGLDVKGKMDLLQDDKVDVLAKTALALILEINASRNLETRMSIVELKGIPLFVTLLSHPDVKLKNSAVGILYTLAINNTEYCKEIIDAGAILLLTALSNDGDADLQEKARSALVYLQSLPGSRPAKSPWEELNEKFDQYVESRNASQIKVNEAFAKIAGVTAGLHEQLKISNELYNRRLEVLEKGEQVITNLDRYLTESKKLIPDLESEQVQAKIEPFTKDVGFPFFLRKHENLSTGCFVRVPLEPGELIIEPPGALAEEWEIEKTDVSEIYERFNGHSLAASSSFDFNAELGFTFPGSSPVTLNTGASASATREKYRFQSRIEINRITQSVFYTPPKDIAEKWKALEPDSSIRNFSHYVSEAIKGARLTLIITFEFDSKELARKARTELAGLPSITAVVSMSQKMKAENAVFDVRHEQVGFVAAPIPEYKKETNIMDYYAAFSKWVMKAKIEAPAVLSIHVTPLSSGRIGKLLEKSEIESYFYQAIMNRRIISMAQQSGLFSGVPRPVELKNNMIKKMSEPDVIIPNEDRIRFRDDKNQYLNIGSEDKMIFGFSPNCDLRLVPQDRAEVLSANTDLFSIQVFRGGESQGYLIAESAGKPTSHYRLRLHKKRYQAKSIYIYLNCKML